MKIMDEKEFSKVNVFDKGNENVNYARYFSGDSFIHTLVDGEKFFLG